MLLFRTGATYILVQAAADGSIMIELHIRPRYGYSISSVSVSMLQKALGRGTEVAAAAAAAPPKGKSNESLSAGRILAPSFGKRPRSQDFSTPDRL